MTGFFRGDATINSDREDAAIVTGFCSPTFRINCLKNAFASICVMLVQMLHVGFAKTVDSRNASLLLLSALNVVALCCYSKKCAVQIQPR